MAQSSPAGGSAMDSYDHSKRSALITEPLSYHDVETKLAACRAAIANGEDVNAQDTLPSFHDNGGRPLDACIRSPHLGNRYIHNLPVIELLLEHGADPRLYTKCVGLLHQPICKAERWAEDEDQPEEYKAFWKRVLQLFQEAIVRLDAKKKEAEENGSRGKLKD